MKKILHLTMLCLFASYIQAQTPGVSIFYEQTSGDTRNYIEYIPGNLPIIISAPHGGVQQSGETIGGVFYPDDDNSLPDRGCGTNERDDNTEILVREIQKEIFAITGCYAHVIINNLHRSKLDPNREINEATCGNSNATAHWNAFHGFIDQASASVEANWGKGVYIDLHGQSHAVPRIEVGYNISASELNSSNLNATSIINKSSIRNLVTNNLNNLSHEQLVRGNNSLGELFQNASGTFYAGLNYPGCGQNGTNGYRAVPSATNNGGGSCDDTRPNGNAYFDGDFYNNRRHGSGNGTSGGIGGAGKIDGIMTEVNRRVRDLGTYNGQVYDTRPQTLVPFAKDYAAVLLNFINIHYNDYALFSYAETSYTINTTNPSPTISGLTNGTFSAPAGLALNPTTGEINTSNSTAGTYTITYAVGTCGYFKNSQNITIANEALQQDSEAPTTPVNLTATNTTETTTNLSWTSATDNIGVVGYNIYQNGILRETSTQTNYSATGLAPNTNYTFRITAIDAVGNESASSNEVTITTLSVPVNYCASQSTNVNDEYISNVQIADINNASDARFYSDFTNITTDVVKNEQYVITVTPTWTGTVYNEAYAVWIDYNKDGDFTDAGEQVWTQGNTQQTPVSGTITIPASATNGATRMRVAMKYNAIPTSCEAFTYGEVEDYTVNIVAAAVDTTAPIITLNGNATINLNVGETYSELGATATDNFDGNLTSSIIISGTVNTASAGTYTVRYNVSDAAGNVATEVIRTVNVLADETAPVITLNGNSTINLNVGDTYSELGATATDNFDGNLTSSIIVSGTVNTASAGTYTVRYNVSDAAGNVATEVIRTINVLADETAPIITLNGNSIINLNVGDSYTELGATATDNFDGNLTSSIIVSGTVNTASAGTYTVRYNVSDTAGNVATEVIRTVNVLADETAPIITLNGNSTINLNVGDSYSELGATATDNFDGNLTSNIIVSGTVNTASAGTYTVRYNVSDAAGNVATEVIRTVNVLADETAPIITLNGNATINLNVGETYSESGATATDNFDGNLTSSIIISGTVNTASAGTYTVRYNVSDTAGNVAIEVTRTVNVLADETAPVITLNGNATINVNVGDTYSELGATATDNFDGNLTSSIIISGTVNTASAGTYTVRYNVSDAAGNVAIEVIRTINVLADETPPIITLNGNSTINLNVGDSYTELGATATDNFDGNLTSSIIVSGTVNTASAGTYTVRYNVSDVAGNVAIEVTRTVNVLADETAPVITLNGNATINVNVGDTYSELGATATDNFDGNLTSNIIVSGTVNTASAGTYLVRYNVSDAAGNVATEVIRTVNVLADETAPIITLNGNATINLNVGDSYSELGATATDNFDGNLTSSIILSGTVNTASAGTYTVRYNVSDTAGNVAIEVIRTVTINEVSNGCANGIDTFPYTQGFENTLGGWTQSTQDDIDWTLDANGTPSSGTGPASAIEGNFYLFVEASGDGTGYPDKQAILTSPCFDLTALNEATFSFSYHMFGTDMGTLAVEISEDNGATWETIWNQTGNQGNVWLTENINISAYTGNNVQLRFNRITGSTWQADIAIDNINLINEEIIIEGCANGIGNYPYAESYENTLNGWTQSSADDLNWTVDANGTPSSGTGPTTATDGSFYIFVEASGNGTGFPNKQAVINSPCYDLSNEASAEFSFSYHMFGATDMGTIALEASNDNGISWITIWSEAGNKGNQWLNVNLDISQYVGGSVQLRFNRITGSTWQADIAIDNILLLTALTARQETTETKDTNTVVATEVVDANTLTVFPNPVRGSILNLKLDQGNVTAYRILNLYGQVVLAGTASNQIKVNKLPSGVYFIEVSDGTKILTKKFIKQ